VAIQRHGSASPPSNPIPMFKKEFQILRQYLGINEGVSIRFSDTKPKRYKKFQDTACTAIVRCIKKKALTYIDRKTGQLCPGGNYFLKITHPPNKEVLDTYVKNERMFKNNKVCADFLKKLPAYPEKAKKRYILISPLTKEEARPDLVLLFATPAQASRILGLYIYKRTSRITVIPGQPTCAALYAPLTSKKIHLNLIDYYDRYYQGKQNEKSLWKDSQMLISIPFRLFEEIIATIPISAHGGFKPNITPQKIDPI